MIFTNKVVALMNFCVGGGSKYLQSQFDGLKEINSIPAYPLKYFYQFWNEWKNKGKNKKQILDLIIRHHRSIIDSRRLKGFNGLTTLGKNKNKFIKLSEKKFRYNFLEFIKKKNLNSKNILLAIHYAYFKTKKFNINQMKSLLIHIHESSEFNMYLKKDFEDSKALVMVRDPINYFWKRIRNDKIIEKSRFDKSDNILLENYGYRSSLINMFYGFKFVNNNFFRKYLFIRFEDLKNNNKRTILKICKYLNLKYSKKISQSTFDNKLWWSDKVYQKKNPHKSKISDFDYSYDYKNFFKYEVLILQFILYRYFKKIGYKNHTDSIKITKLYFFKFLLYLFLPTKFEIKILLRYLNIVTLIVFFFHSFNETFLKRNIKNYYFNAMYRFKPQYKNLYFLKFSFLRYIVFRNIKKSNFNPLILVLRVLYFLNKILFYFFAIINSFFLYFKRIYFLISYYFLIKKLDI